MSQTSLPTRSREQLPDATLTALLETFAQTQARPSLVDIGLEGDDRPPLPVRALGPLLPLPRGCHEALATVAYPGGSVSASLPLTHRVLSLLSAVGVQRYEPRSAVNPHRAHPAAHCFFAAHVFLLAGGSAWHLDTVGWQLAGMHPDPAAGQPMEALERAIDGDGGALLAIVGHLDSVPGRYRELRWGLVHNESGHLSELLVHAARVHGLSVRTRDHFPDSALLEALGLATDGSWMPGTVVELGRAGGSDLLPPAGTREEKHEETPSPGPAAVPSAARLAVEEVDRSAWLPPQGPWGPPRQRTLADPVPPDSASAPWAQVIFERSAARANKGLTARPVPLPAEALHHTVAALCDGLGPQPPVSEGGIGALLLVGTVRDHQAGVYDVSADGALRLRSATAAMAALQECFTYPRTQMSVLSCPAALVLVGDHPAQLHRAGARRLRTAQLDLGRALQAAGLAMTVHDGFLRPARSFDPDLLRDLLDLPEDHLPCYAGLLGESRFTDLLMDVRP